MSNKLDQHNSDPTATSNPTDTETTGRNTEIEDNVLAANGSNDFSYE